MSRSNARREAPRLSSDRISRSNDTDGSPASILAILDWLDRSRFASSACVRLRRRRHSRKPNASCSLSSTYAASSALSCKKSWAVPNFQPFASRRRRLSSRTAPLPQPADARVDDPLRCGPALLAEDLENHDRIGVGPVHDPPIGFGTTDPQLLAAGSDDRHGPRLRHPKRVSLLQQSKQVSGLDPGLLRKGRRLDFSVKPHKRLVARAHTGQRMSDPACCQDTAARREPHNKPFHLTPASLPPVARSAAGERQRTAYNDATIRMNDTIGPWQGQRGSYLTKR